jgi:ABC-type multidrug transport system fused ATPase/permease subunit
MDLLTPENLGGAQLSLAAIALWAFIRAVSKISVLADKVGTAAAKIGKAIDAFSGHLKEEKRHHAVLESSSQEQVEILRRMERGNSAPTRVVTGDHTPVPVSPGE